MYSSEDSGRWSSWKASNTVLEYGLKYSNQLPQGNSNILYILLKKWWRLGGKQVQVVLIMSEEFGPYTARCKSYTTLQTGQQKEVEHTQQE
jgi:hypothetical protein